MKQKHFWSVCICCLKFPDSKKPPSRAYFYHSGLGLASAPQRLRRSARDAAVSTASAAPGPATCSALRNKGGTRGPEDEAGFTKPSFKQSTTPHPQILSG